MESAGKKLWEQFNNPSASMWRRGEVGKKLWNAHGKLTKIV